MKALRNSLLTVAFLFIAYIPLFSQTQGGVATLYANDPLAGSLCLLDGKEGKVFQQGEVRNRCSDIDFNSYAANHFAVGIEGGRIGRIIDLGTSEQLQRSYGYQETVGRGQGFASINFDGTKSLLIKGVQTQPRTSAPNQELKESALLFRIGKPSATAAIKNGHIYVVRLTDTNDQKFQLIAKIIVLSFVPGESVTIRWQVL